MNFRLNTLRLGTDFDQPIEPLPVPGAAKKGQTSALWMLDGASRAPHRLARLVKPVGLLGVKVAETGQDLRVSVTLLVDETSTHMWNKVHTKRDEEPILTSEFHQHRLVEVSAQGRPRAVTLLALRGGDGKPGVRQQVHFDLPASEVGDSGLLMFSFEEPAGAPEWARAGLLEDGLVGMCVANVKVAPVPSDPVAPWASSGRPRRRKREFSPTRPGFFVVNAGDAQGAVAVTLIPRLNVPRPKPRGRREKVKAPLHAVADWARRSRARGLEGRPVQVEAVSVDGQSLVSTVVQSSGAGDYAFTLPPGTRSAFVRARVLRDKKVPRPVDWAVEVREGPTT